jgi:hypothetical protein
MRWSYGRGHGSGFAVGCSMGRRWGVKRQVSMSCLQVADASAWPAPPRHQRQHGVKKREPRICCLKGWRGRIEWHFRFHAFILLSWTLLFRLHYYTSCCSSVYFSQSKTLIHAEDKDRYKINGASFPLCLIGEDELISSHHRRKPPFLIYEIKKRPPPYTRRLCHGRLR